ncbi:MAG: VCBS repeat-containing protein [bacterium]|nr:VCBS repeat-containing protein [bacterium]
MPLCLLLTLLPAVPGASEAARRSRLELRHTHIELPGAPSAIVPADLDGDGVQDLAVVIAYTEWESIGIEERTEMDDVEGLVEVLTVVPALMDHRELWTFLGQSDGRYLKAGEPLALETSVLSLTVGPPGYPIVALTDEGLSALRLQSDGRVELEPILSERSVLAGSATFVPDLGIVYDLDADGREDLLFPTADGAAVYLSTPEGLASEPAARLGYPTRDRESGRELIRHYPLPRVGDVNGDGLPDLLLRNRESGWDEFQLMVNAGKGDFSEPLAPLEAAEEDGDEDEDGEPEVVFFGDLDGDGVAEYVTEEDLSDGDGFREEIREAKEPPFLFRVHRTGPGHAMVTEPYVEIAARGYGFEGQDEILLPGGFQDLDGDGREDLITLTLDFSLMQVVRILAVRSISIGLDFHIWCQQEDGGFREVTGLDLSGKFRLNLDNLRIGQLSQFAGDYDGDGRADFVQMGRGRTVTIHRGREGCHYPPAPDLKIRLKQAPKDLSLVRVADYDGDGLTDLLVIQPQKVKEDGATLPVRLDIYLSGGAA